MRSISFIRSIGSGAFGTVYLADLSSRQGFHRQVAVKVLHRQSSNEGEQLLSRIRDEARLLGLLQDDIIIKVIEIARIASHDAVLMEYIEGVDLQSVLDAGHRPPPRALAEIGALVAGGLSRAHEAVHPATGEHLNVIHRDVKPANIMVTRSGGVKLLDFGVARARFDARESHTGQLVLGTLNYMAPEYIVTGEVSPAADIYGLAVSLWQVATGEPFGQPKVRQDSHERRVRQRLSALHPELGPMQVPLERMLQWDHHRRPSARDVEAAFDQVSIQLSGSSLRVWARTAVAEVLRARGPGKDSAGFVGTTVELGDGDSPPAAPAPPSQHIPDPTRVGDGVPARPPERPRPQSGEPPRPQSPIPPRPQPVHATPSPAPANPQPSAAPPRPEAVPPRYAPSPPPSSGWDPALVRAIVGGLLVGSSVGLVFVALFVGWLLTR
jgi:serine/threonine protein kinase